MKSQNMEAIITEVDPRIESRLVQHDGEELHLILGGEMQYSVKEKT